MSGKSSDLVTLVVYALVIIAAAALVSLRAAQLSPSYHHLSHHPVFDFESLYLTGELALQGRLACAYEVACMSAQETARFGSVFFNHVAVPPPYALLLAVLALAPAYIAYAVFAGLSFFAYLLTLRAIAGEDTKTILLLFFPTILDTLMTGQSGLLTSALIAGACIWLVRGDARAGIPMGLMLIKPHVALTIATTAVCYRAWRTAVVAIATVAALLVVCAAFFGFGVWPAFLHGLQATGRELLQGRWSPTIMVSVYQTAANSGVSLENAHQIQLAVSLAVIGCVYLMSRRARLADTAGFALVSATLMSPYFFYYDFLLASIGVALLLPSISAHEENRKSAHLILSATASAWRFVQNYLPTEIAPILPAASVVTACTVLILTLAWSATTPPESAMESPARL